MKRRKPNLTAKLAVLTAQAFCGCQQCRVKMAAMIRRTVDVRSVSAIPLKLDCAAQFHHLDERANSGDDSAHNLVAVTPECHRIETYKPGGSVARVVKERKRRKREDVIAGFDAAAFSLTQDPPERPRPKRAWPKRKFQQRKAKGKRR